MIVAPTIETVSPIYGVTSTKGMLLNITGYGFSKILAENVVSILDVTCDVISADFFNIYCKCPPLDAPPAS